MRALIIVLLGTLLFFSNCAVKRKTKEAERIEVSSENQVKNDSVGSAMFKIDRNQSDLTINSFESVLKALNVQYDGDQGNDLKVVLNHTENGTELNVSGKGKANYNQSSENTYSLNRQDVAMIFDSIIDARVSQMKTERSKQLLDSFKSDTTKEKTDISFWIYAVIGSVLVVGAVIYVAIKQLKGGK